MMVSVFQSYNNAGYNNQNTSGMVNELADAVSELTDAVSELTDAVSDLTDAVSEFLVVF